MRPSCSGCCSTRSLGRSPVVHSPRCCPPDPSTHAGSRGDSGCPFPINGGETGRKAADLGKGTSMSNLVLHPQRTAQLRRLTERGLTTVEYAIGLLAAATVAILLVRVFSDNAFFQVLFDWVTGVFGKVLQGDFNISDLLKVGG
ncbi:DUF4244 domain-containing protein [Tessaracoccus sp. ZS01]|nr:DUF4244 domain-containing protein [Tessaracoccus sp. ZS01]